MGNTSSSVHTFYLNEPLKGYHTKEVIKGSPAEKANIIPVFDLILAIDDIILDKDDTVFLNTLFNNLGVEVTLVVYNMYSKSIRDVVVIPDLHWGGDGLLGLTVSYCKFDTKRPLIVYDISSESEPNIKEECSEIDVSPGDVLIGIGGFYFNPTFKIESTYNQQTTLYVYKEIGNKVDYVTINSLPSIISSQHLGIYKLKHRIV